MSASINLILSCSQLVRFITGILFWLEATPSQQEESWGSRENLHLKNFHWFSLYEPKIEGICSTMSWPVRCDNIENVLLGKRTHAFYEFDLVQSIEDNSIEKGCNSYILSDFIKYPFLCGYEYEIRLEVYWWSLACQSMEAISQWDLIENSIEPRSLRFSWVKGSRSTFYKEGRTGGGGGGLSHGSRTEKTTNHGSRISKFHHGWNSRITKNNGHGSRRIIY